MNQLERDLRNALRETQPPVGFADRVLATTRRRSWVWLAAAALVVLMVGGGVVVREQRRRMEGERSKEQLMAGLRITGEKLNAVQLRLFKIQQRPVQQQSNR